MIGFVISGQCIYFCSSRLHYEDNRWKIVQLSKKTSVSLRGTSCLFTLGRQPWMNKNANMFICGEVSDMLLWSVRVAAEFHRVWAEVFSPSVSVITLPLLTFECASLLSTVSTDNGSLSAAIQMCSRHEDKWFLQFMWRYLTSPSAGSLFICTDCSETSVLDASILQSSLC